MILSDVNWMNASDDDVCRANGPMDSGVVMDYVLEMLALSQGRQEM